MDAPLQAKIISLLHFALNPKGILFLGTSETIGQFSDLFQPLDTKCKVYKRKEGISDHIIDYPTKGEPVYRPNGPSEDAAKIPMPIDIQALAEKMILDRYAPAGVLINDKYEILHFVGRTDRYLGLPTGKPSFNLLTMARMDLKFRLTTALHQAIRDRKPTTCKGIQIRCNGNFCVVDVSISPLTDAALPPGLFLVVFEDRPSDHAADDEPRQTGQDPKVQQLEQELQSTREYVQASIEELETSNEELKSTNEELQSTNEELHTVNAELEKKVFELSKAGDDMQNLLAATDIAAIFLDTHLCIQRYTPAAARIIKLIATDIGRPLSDLRTCFPRVELAQEAKGVLDDLNSLELEIESQDHIWYLLRVMPYRTVEDVIKGVVMTLVNIQKFRRLEDRLRRLAAVLEDSNDAITVQDFEGLILAWNKGAERMYGWTESEALKLNRADLVPKDRLKETQALIDRIKKGEAVRAFKTQRTTKSGQILDIWMTATTLADKEGRPVEMATTERDLAWLSDG